MAGSKKRSGRLPYRRCVGLCVFNRDGLVFVGRRRDGSPEHVSPGHEWQMPQGGIDAGEKAVDAAFRELREETNIRSVSLLAKTPGWLKYDLPGGIAKAAWKGRYRGQKQKWFALRFTGEDREIDVEYPDGGRHGAEFADWMWVPLAETVDLVIPFKRDVYRDVARAFSAYAGADIAAKQR